MINTEYSFTFSYCQWLIQLNILQFYKMNNSMQYMINLFIQFIFSIYYCHNGLFVFSITVIVQNKIEVKQQQSEIKSKILQSLPQEYNCYHMFAEQDAFFKQLPFTLPPDQSKPAYVVLGSGLQQCLISAHLSKLQRVPGLTLDLQKSYGASIKTATIKQLHNFSTGRDKLQLYKFLKTGYQDTNNTFIENILKNKQYKGYNIDLQPSFFFGTSLACQLLKQADMDKYMDFRCVTNMLHLTNTNKLTNVPLSKGKIFSSQSLSLLQKKILLSTFHSLVQIYNKYTNTQQDQNSTKQFDKQFGNVDQKLYNQFIMKKDQYFLEFIMKLAKNNQKIMDYVAYVIANYQYDYRNLEGNGDGWGAVPQWTRREYSLEQFIKRVGKFVRSCGVYSESPYLYVDNGIGDVPQSYSRIASLYLSTYIIHPRIEINKISVQPERPLPQPQPTQQNTAKSKPEQQKQSLPNLQPSQQSFKPATNESSQSTSPPQNLLHIQTNLSPKTPIQCQTLYISPSYFHLFSQQEYYIERILRIVLVCQKIGNQQQCPSIVYMTHVNKQDEKDKKKKSQANPVFLFVFDNVSHSCPDGKILYQFQEVVNNGEDFQELAKIKVKKYIDVLTKARGQQFQNSIHFVTAYIRQKRYPKNDPIKPSQESSPTKVFLKDHSGIDLDSEFVNFKQIVGQQKTYFRIINKQGQPHYHHEEQYEGDQTVGLIQKLHNIDIHRQKQEQQEQEQQKGKEDEVNADEHVGNNANQKGNNGGQQAIQKQVNKQQDKIYVKQSKKEVQEQQKQVKKQKQTEKLNQKSVQQSVKNLAQQNSQERVQNSSKKPTQQKNQ